LAQAQRSERAIVIGVDFVGRKVAASLHERSLAVTVAGREAAPFQRKLGEEIGQAFVTLQVRI
jgi:Trk K+ transport system NAD-binding subunit